MTHQDEGSQALRAPFPEGFIKRKPKGGRSLSYVPGERVIERLLDVLGPDGWSWELLAVEILPDGALVRGRLTALGRVADGVDFHEYAAAKGGGLAPEATANAIKGADTGALVRAARLLGVGLELWHDGEPAAGSTPEGRPATDGERMACRASAAQLGWDDDGLDDHIRRSEAYSEPLTGAGAQRLRFDLAMMRAKRVRGKLGISGKELVDRVGGNPTKMDIEELENELLKLEREASV